MVKKCGILSVDPGKGGERSVELRAVIAENMAELRRRCGMTQLELAEKLNYTDKAVSKWERGDSVPDIVVLKQIADLFGVTVDYLLQETHEAPPPAAAHAENRRHARGIITWLAVLLVWMSATVVFVVTKLAAPEMPGMWLAFVAAVPASMVVWLVFNAVWFSHGRNYLIISLLMWSLLATLHVSLLMSGFNYRIWLIYTLGVPGQIIILLWSNVKQKKSN